ncbi:hydroxyethylthiazole kinase [Clostridia bacterium]|nr:hydroxyethylthiazole kinase [Clostridia bacterium]
MFKEIFDNVRAAAPLVHNITNYVTVNDCANVLLACGASPIMADDIDEAADITRICGALNINIGTLSQNTIPSMFAAGKASNELSHPLVLDPVGAGASALRTNTAKKLIEELEVSVIRGNISEIKALALGAGGAKGVDADVLDLLTEETLENAVSFTKRFAKEKNTIVAVTGAIDIVTDGETAYTIRNGNANMGKITGTGCMLSSLVAAFAAANREKLLESAAAAVIAMGLAGEQGFARLGERDGNAAFRQYIIDAIYNMNGEILDAGAKYERV